MTKYLLAFFFLLMYAGDTLGLSASLAPGVSIKNMLLYLVLTGIAVNAAVARNRKVELAGAMAMFCGLIGYAFVTWIALTFIVQDPGYLVKGAFIAMKSSLVDQFLTFLIFFYGVLQLKDAMWLIRAMLWIIVLSNVVTIIDTMNIPDLGLLPVPRKGGRFEGFIGQPNEYGLLLSLYIPLCTALFLEVRGKLRLLAGLGVFASILALILTGSRGAYVGTIGGLVVGSIYLRQYVSATTVVRAGAAIGIACVAVVVTSFATGYAHLFLDRFAGLEGNPHVATSGRSSIWMNAIDAMLENPLSFVTGYGFFSYDSDRSYRLATHNIYLYHLYNLGVIGLFLFIGVFRRILSAARLAIAEASGSQRLYLMALVFGLCSFMLAIFFNQYNDMGYLLWATAGAAMRVAMCLREPAAEQAPEAQAATGRGLGAGGPGYSPAWYGPEEPRR
jgi:O-antigen ligase